MTATETLRIKNFAGIKDAEIELSRMNVFIGPQASGKSVCAKLFFYFKEIVRRTGFDLQGERSKSQMRAGHRARFLEYFPPAAWSDSGFKIEYICGDLGLTVVRKGVASPTVDVLYSEYYDAFIRRGRSSLKNAARDVLAERRESGKSSSGLSILFYSLRETVAQKIGPPLSNDNHFIPAGRSFFSTLELSLFSLIAEGVAIDPFMAEFGQFYTNARRAYTSQPDAQADNSRELSERISRLLCGTYKQVRSRDYILSDDGRRVAIENCSSGQQEALPLTAALYAIAQDTKKGSSATMFVEEPEAHLYPTAQREVVHLLADVMDLSSEESANQYVITTHSPYILSALNNLMYGAQVARQSPDKARQVSQVLGDAALIAPENVRAYAFGDGRVRSIIDAETNLVRATVLDGVSNELAKEFGDLLDIDFEEEDVAA